MQTFRFIQDDDDWLESFLHGGSDSVFLTACQEAFRAVSWGLNVEQDHGVGVPWMDWVWIEPSVAVTEPSVGVTELSLCV